MFAVVGYTRAVDIESSEDLRDAFVQAEHNLHMASRVLRDNGDGILRADRSSLGEDAIANFGLDLFDLFNGLILIQPIKEDVNVRGRCEVFMVV